MFDEMYADRDRGRHCPTALRAGALVYLWRPGERPWHDGNQPVLGRVERTTKDNIVAIDLRDNGRSIYDVANPSPAHRWTWQLAAAPQAPTCMGNGVEIVEAPLSMEDRTRLVAGEPGVRLQVRMASGEVLWGTLQRLVMGQNPWEAEWAELVDAPPGRDAVVHVVRVAEVAGVTRFRRA